MRFIVDPGRWRFSGRGFEVRKELLELRGGAQHGKARVVGDIPVQVAGVGLGDQALGAVVRAWRRALRQPGWLPRMI